MGNYHETPGRLKRTKTIPQNASLSQNHQLCANINSYDKIVQIKGRI